MERHQLHFSVAKKNKQYKRNAKHIEKISVLFLLQNLESICAAVLVRTIDIRSVENTYMYMY